MPVEKEDVHLVSVPSVYDQNVSYPFTTPGSKVSINCALPHLAVLSQPQDIKWRGNRKQILLALLLLTWPRSTWGNDHETTAPAPRTRLPRCGNYFPATGSIGLCRTNVQIHCRSDTGPRIGWWE